MTRRCLDCPKLIQAGSRCVECARKHDRARKGHRSGYSRSTWARRVKERDVHRCRVPGCTTPHDRLQAHHIKPLSLGGSDALENGLTLCWAHHQRQHGGGR